MKQKLTATLGCLALSCALYAQNGWLPPVTFPANSNACDANNWKLVFYDEFNGTSLAPIWKTAVTYDKGWICRNGFLNNSTEHEYHGGARYNDNGGPCLYLKSNIVVSNGTCKLLMKYEPNASITLRDSQTCGNPLITRSADLTGAIIKLPQEDNATGARIGYSSGRFQARMKIPNFEDAWTAFWMWWGRGGVDEIDITETWAGSGLHPVHFNSVAWNPHDAFFANPYQLPGSISMNREYPYQGWYNYLFRSHPGVKYLNKEDWHTYTYEWDTASISAQLDNETPAKVWKYYQTKIYYHGGYVNGQWYAYMNPYTAVVGSGCNPGSGQWNIMYGYPWNNDTPNCDVRFEAKFSGNADKYHSQYGNTSHDLGQWEIDYLKIWQRHPEKDNHTELCAANTYPPAPVITGPEQVCPIGSFTVSPVIPGGHWEASSQFSLSSTIGDTVSLAKNAGQAFNGGWISYRYGNGVEGCPTKSVFKNNLYCNQSTDWVVASPYVTTNQGEGHFHLISELYYKRDVTGGTTPLVTWNVSINRGQDSYDSRTAENYTLEGQYVSTPVFPVPDNGSYNLRWTMNVTDASGTWSRSGERNSTTELMQQKNDPNTFYLNAYIDDEDSYNNTVQANVAANMVSEEEYGDALFMHEMIEKKRAEALQPYLITGGLELFKKTSDLNQPDNDASIASSAGKLKVYPNPTTSDITIIAGADFKDGEDIQLNLHDLLGHCVYSEVMHYQKGNVMNVSLSTLPNSTYILTLKQGNTEAHIKITKNEL